MDLDILLESLDFQVLENMLILNDRIPDGQRIEWDGDIIAKRGGGDNIKISGAQKITISGDLGAHFDFSGDGPIIITGNLGDLAFIETQGAITIYGDIGQGCYFYAECGKIEVTGTIGEGSNLFSPAICAGSYSPNVLLSRLIGTDAPATAAA